MSNHKRTKKEFEELPKAISVMVLFIAGIYNFLVGMIFVVSGAFSQKTEWDWDMTQNDVKDVRELAGLMSQSKLDEQLKNAVKGYKV